MFVLLFWDKLTVFLGEGPYWLNYQSDEACDKYWWSNLLYINNFYPTQFGASVSFDIIVLLFFWTNIFLLGQYFTTENLCISFITSSIKCKYEINCHVNIIDERITLHVLFTYFYINS